MKDEIRYFPIDEFRIEGEDKGVRKLVGYAAVFDRLSVDLGGFREKISRGAFTESIQNDDIWAFWAHDVRSVLGRKSAGTLTITEDEHGLRTEITIPDTQVGRDALVSVERGDVDQMSFRFRLNNKEHDQRFERINGEVIRTLEKLTLKEVSPTALASYPDTEIEARSSLLDEAIRNNRIPQPEGGASGGGEDISQGRSTGILRKKLDLNIYEFEGK